MTHARYILDSRESLWWKHCNPWIAKWGQDCVFRRLDTLGDVTMPRAAAGV